MYISFNKFFDILKLVHQQKVFNIIHPKKIKLLKIKKLENKFY